MTKKDYIIIAHVLYDAKSKNIFSTLTCLDIASNFCRYFASDNPRFDEEKFLAACGLDDAGRKAKPADALYYPFAEHQSQDLFSIAWRSIPAHGDNKGNLVIVYRKGRATYEYYAVPRGLYFDVLRSDSPGSALHTLVKSQGYEYRKVSPVFSPSADDIQE